MPITVNLSWTPVPGSYGTLIEYKKEGDTVWTTPSSPDNPTIYSTYSLSLDSGFYYYIRFTTQSQTCSSKYAIKQIYVSGGLDCCPVGYTLSPDSTYCYKEETAAADVTGGSLQLLCHFTSAANYGNYGVVIYKAGKYNVDGTWTVADPTAKPEMISLGTGLGYNAAAFNTTVIATPHVWLNSDFVSAVDSRLNKGGLWKCAAQSYVGSLGFSRQIIVPSTKTYYIGVGADDSAKIQINGVTVLDQDISTLLTSTYFNGSNLAFRYWHVYPVTLLSGPNIITLTGTNTGSLGIMGFEIYDATELQLKTVTTEAGLNPYIIFTTRDIVNNSPSDLANYSCVSNPGYSLVYDPIGNTYFCKKITTNPTISC